MWVGGLLRRHQDLVSKPQNPCKSWERLLPPVTSAAGLQPGSVSREYSLRERAGRLMSSPGLHVSLSHTL